jgi:hypothetical protein
LTASALSPEPFLKCQRTTALLAAERRIHAAALNDHKTCRTPWPSTLSRASDDGSDFRPINHQLPRYQPPHGPHAFLVKVGQSWLKSGDAPPEQSGGCNPNGIVPSSPGLRACELPREPASRTSFPTSKRLRLLAAQGNHRGSANSVPIRASPPESARPSYVPLVYSKV